ncbi:MAG: hypothetical protein LBC41_15175 [Clostridiales bacterium]|nr:hypothetical protein [Clostridiales bacterium]MDR2751995.1 hypothetical protein [Clostridiales bacterium]
MQVGEAGYILGSSELIFLAVLAGARKLLGFVIEEQISTAKDAEELWKKIEPTLTQKRYLSKDADGLADVDRNLLEQIKICANPELVYTCKTSAGGRETDCCYYASQGKYAKLERDTNVDNRYILTPLRSYARFTNSVYDLMEYFEEFDEFPISVDMKAEDVKKAMSTPVGRLKNEPFAAGVPLDALSDIAEALGDKGESKLAVAIDARDGRMVADVMSFKGKKRLWKLERNGTEAFKLRALSSEAYLECVKDIAGFAREEGGQGIA